MNIFFISTVALMAITTRLLMSAFGRDLGRLAHAYIIDDFNIGTVCQPIPNKRYMQLLFAAGYAGHAELLGKCFDRRCLYGLAVGGYAELLMSASCGILGHMDVKYRQRVLNKCLKYACAAGKQEVINVLINLGADECNLCKKSMVGHCR